MLIGRGVMFQIVNGFTIFFKNWHNLGTSNLDAT
jgi:hypothetical protein